MVNKAYKLPDSYQKDARSNNYKMLELTGRMASVLEADIGAVRDMLDIYTVAGKTLDLYGEMLDEKRGGMNDEQYRFVLLTKIGRNIGTGEMDSVIELIALLLQIDAREIILNEDYPGKITLDGVALERLIDAGFTTGQATTMISAFLPPGISIGRATFPTETDAAFYFYGMTSEEIQYEIDTWGYGESQSALTPVFGAAVICSRAVYSDLEV